MMYSQSPYRCQLDWGRDGTHRDIENVLWECGSGRELREMGFGADVQHAAQLNVYDFALVMQNDYLTRFNFSN